MWWVRCASFPSLTDDDIMLHIFLPPALCVLCALILHWESPNSNTAHGGSSSSNYWWTTPALGAVGRSSTCSTKASRGIYVFSMFSQHRSTGAFALLMASHVMLCHVLGFDHLTGGLVNWLIVILISCCNHAFFWTLFFSSQFFSFLCIFCIVVRLFLGYYAYYFSLSFHFSVWIDE